MRNLLFAVVAALVFLVSGCTDSNQKSLDFDYGPYRFEIIVKDDTGELIPITNWHAYNIKVGQTIEASLEWSELGIPPYPFETKFWATSGLEQVGPSTWIVRDLSSDQMITGAIRAPGKVRYGKVNSVVLSKDPPI